MGYHSTSKGTVWGDTPAEILQEAFNRISKDFSEYCGQKLTREDLIIGCFCGIEDHFPRKIRPLPKRKKHNLGSVVEAHIENKTEDCPFIDNRGEKLQQRTMKPPFE